MAVYIPRKGAPSYKYTSLYWVMDETKYPFRSYDRSSSDLTNQSAEYKSNTVKSDHVLPTTYGRVTHSAFAVDRNNSKFYLGGYLGDKPTPYCPVYSGPNSILVSGIPTTKIRFRDNVNYRNRVNTEALAGFMSDDINVSATVAEVGETAGYVAGKLLALAKGMKAIKTGNLKQLKRLVQKSIRPDSIPKTVASRYLEYKYAIRPMVMEIEGGMKILADGLAPETLKDKPWLIMSQATAMEPRKSSESPSVSIKLEQHAEVLHRTALWAEVESAELYGLARMGATNIAGGLWEATIFSFVIDWALPIGTFLAALSATQGLSFHHGFYSMRGTCTADETLTKSYNGLDSFHSGKTVTYGFVRQALYGFPSAMPYVKSPFKLGNGLSTIALLSQLLPSKRT